MTPRTRLTSRSSGFAIVNTKMARDNFEVVDVLPSQNVLHNEPSRSGDQYSGNHAGASRSRSEILVTGSGQLIRRVGSRHRRERALSATKGALMT